MTGQELRQKREELGMTREEFARALGLYVSTVTTWETYCLDGEVGGQHENILLGLAIDQIEKRLQLQGLRARRLQAHIDKALEQSK
jgi:DNA-binding XRE family transcriptional regulator